MGGRGKGQQFVWFHCDLLPCLGSAVLTQQVGDREEGGLGVGEGPSLFRLCLQPCLPIDKKLPHMTDRQLGAKGRSACILSTLMTEV